MVHRQRLPCPHVRSSAHGRRRSARTRSGGGRSGGSRYPAAQIAGLDGWIRAERLRSAFEHHAAAAQDVHVAGDIQRDAGILFDQEERSFDSRLTCRRMSKMSLTMSGASPSDGSSSNTQRGRAMSARPIASICCSPARQIASHHVATFLQAWKICIVTRERSAATPRAGRVKAPARRLSSTLKWGNTRRPSIGYVGTRAARNTGGGPTPRDPGHPTRSSRTLPVRLRFGAIRKLP